MACVIKSAYDKLPQALRREEFFFWVATFVDAICWLPPVTETFIDKK